MTSEVKLRSPRGKAPAVQEVGPSGPTEKGQKQKGLQPLKCRAGDISEGKLQSPKRKTPEVQEVGPSGPTEKAS
jgi:hypothetical protein